MTAWFVDSSVLLTASGMPHPQRGACRQFVAHSAGSDNSAHVSVETIQEVLFHRMRRSGREMALAATRELANSCVLHTFDTDVLQRSIDLVAATPIRGRDAVIAATALLAGFDTIVSLDTDFDVVPELSRISPEQALH